MCASALSRAEAVVGVVSNASTRIGAADALRAGSQSVASPTQARRRSSFVEVKARASYVSVV